MHYTVRTIHRFAALCSFAVEAGYPRLSVPVSFEQGKKQWKSTSTSMLRQSPKYPMANLKAD
jgi:hypothetical protein